MEGTRRSAAESDHLDWPGQDGVGRILLAACEGAAIIGGLLFVVLVAMSIMSIVGRKVAAAPVPGDVEILQMGAAIASSTFFAYCHMLRRHVKVDFFTAFLPGRWGDGLDVVGSLLLGAVGALIAARTWAGALSLRDAGETSAIFALPVWVAQISMVPGFVLMAAAGLYMAGWHIRRIAAGIGARG